MLTFGTAVLTDILGEAAVALPTCITAIMESLLQSEVLATCTSKC